MRPQFTTTELEPTGKYYVNVPLSRMDPSAIKDPIYRRPISPKENWRMLLSGEKPYWIPTWGVFASDIHEFRPRIQPECVADRQFFDGEERPDFDALPLITKGWFGLEWQFVPAVGGSTVRPGNPLVTDINNWRNQVEIPSLEDIDWDALKNKNQCYFDNDKYKLLGIPCGLWERLMALMDVEEACIALVDEDQQDGVRDFLEWYSDFLISYIGKIKDTFPEIDGVLIHDDWAHTKGPFFSTNTARDMLVPYTKKIIDYCHGRDMFYEIHCCGNCEMLIPLFIEMGADVWGGQEKVNDFEVLAEKYKDENFVFGIEPFYLPEDASDEEYDKAGKEWVEKYKDYHIMLRILNLTDGRMADKRFVDSVYKYSRIEFAKNS